MNVPLKPEQIIKGLNGDCNFMIYSDLRKYDTIEDAIGPTKKLVILYLSTPHYGHFCCVWINDKNELCFFDPYGMLPDDELEFIPDAFRFEGGQLYPLLTYLLWKSPKKVNYNEFKLQKVSNKISTCGRWCLVRLEYPNLSDKKFSEIFMGNKHTPDRLIYEMTRNI